MENRKPKSSGFSGAPPPCGITGPVTTSVMPPHAMSSAPQPRGTSGSERPPRLVPHLTAKPRRRPFVVPAPQHTEGAPVPGQDVSSLGGILPRRLPDEVGAPSTMVPRRLTLASPVPAVAATKSLPPRDTHPSSFTDLLLSSCYNTKTSPLDHDAAWDTQINASSTFSLGYEAAEDDRSPTKNPVFDWTPRWTPSTTDYAANVRKFCPKSFSSSCKSW
jgi:hypothetical protein